MGFLKGSLFNWCRIGLTVSALAVGAFICGSCGNNNQHSSASDPNALLSPSQTPGEQQSKWPLDIEFDNVAQKAGLNYKWTPPGKHPLTILGTVGNGCAFLDYNNDGNLDILLVGPKLALYGGDGKGHFTDVTHKLGLDRFHGEFLGCAVGDYDNDGYPDIYILAHDGGLLLHNEHGQSFRDVTKEAGIKPQSWGGGAAFVDIDNDGKLDLYIGNYLQFGPDSKQLCDYKTTMGACNPRSYKSLSGVLYHNLGNGKFEDATKKWGVDQLVGPTMGIAPSDYDSSGHQSIYLGNDAKPANLLHNDGTKFTDVAAMTGTNGYHNEGFQSSMGVDWGDYDNDGKLDLAVATFSFDDIALYHNAGQGAFTEIEDNTGLHPIGRDDVKFGLKWIDANNSGWLDMIMASGHVIDTVAKLGTTQRFLENTEFIVNDSGNHFFRDPAALPGSSGAPILGRGLAIGDFLNNGREDVLIVDSQGSPLLLQNNTKTVGHWLEINLVGTTDNKDGQGALITAEIGGHSFLRQCTTSGSYMSASDKRVLLGLANSTVVDSLEVRWPSGHVDTYKNIAADKIITIQEGAPTPM